MNSALNGGIAFGSYRLPNSNIFNHDYQAENTKWVWQITKQGRPELPQFRLSVLLFCLRTACLLNKCDIMQATSTMKPIVVRYVFGSERRSWNERVRLTICWEQKHLESGTLMCGQPTTSWACGFGYFIDLLHCLLLSMVSSTF
ncbi:hypothetical protein ES708_13349 [subsurface metagenome]